MIALYLRGWEWEVIGGGGGDEEGEGEGVCVCVWASEDNRLPWFHMHGELGKGKGKRKGKTGKIEDAKGNGTTRMMDTAWHGVIQGVFLSDDMRRYAPHKT